MRIGRYLSDAGPIQNGLKKRKFLSPLLFHFGFEYTIANVQEDSAYCKYKRKAARHCLDINEERTAQLVGISGDVSYSVSWVSFSFPYRV